MLSNFPVGYATGVPGVRRFAFRDEVLLITRSSMAVFRQEDTT